MCYPLKIRTIIIIIIINMVSWQKMMSRLPGENLNYFIFWSYCPLQILTLKTCSQDISKTFTASSLKLFQLEDYLVNFF